MNSLSVRIDTAAVAVIDSSSAKTVTSKNALFALLAETASKCYGLDSGLVYDRLTSRESIGSTGFGGGVAIPHAKIDGLNKCAGILVRLSEPMAFDAHDGRPVDLVFCLLSPSEGGSQHLKALAEISRFLRDENTVSKIRGADSEDAIYVLLAGKREQQAA